MEKINFTATKATLDALDRLQQSLRDLIASLEDEQAKEPAKDLTVYAVPQTHTAKPEKKTTIEEVRAVLSEKAQEGKTALVKMLLERFGVTRLTDADPADYAEILEAGRRL